MLRTIVIKTIRVTTATVNNSHDSGSSRTHAFLVFNFPLIVVQTVKLPSVSSWEERARGRRGNWTTWVQVDDRFGPKRGVSCARSTKLLMTHNPKAGKPYLTGLSKRSPSSDKNGEQGVYDVTRVTSSAQSSSGFRLHHGGFQPTTRLRPPALFDIPRSPGRIEVARS
jgi:hypothetical protein